MTSTPDDPPVPTQPIAATRIRPIALFARNCHALWVTTYGVDLSLVNEFLLAQLGDPPVNLTVLADATRLADALDRTRDVASLTAVNRRWLLRGMQRGAGAFHPKSYLAVTATRATLFVGSGNLNADGLGSGKELFTQFTTGTVHGDAAVRTWLQWARRLVADSVDMRLVERFEDLRSRLPDLPTDADSEGNDAVLLHNLDQALLPQLVERVQARDVDELLLTAPFYDPEAAAAALVDAFTPRHVQVWAAEDTNVNGQALLARLGALGAKVTLWRYSPDRFVHAKLIGVITGARGWLMSGSANLSRAALTLTPEVGGNVELAVLNDLSAAHVRSTYQPPDVSVESWPEAQFERLTFTVDPHQQPLPVRLLSAELTSQGDRLRVRTAHTTEPSWRLTDGEHYGPITPSADAPGYAECPWPNPGRLVWLCDEDGQALSNRIVVDDPPALAAALHAEGNSGDTARPPELHLSDMDTPLGRLLEGFHRHLIMDVSELNKHAMAATANEDETDPVAADELWERLQREQLVRDPRIGIYRGFRTPAATSGDFLLELLEMLRDRAPAGTEATHSPFRATVTYLNEIAQRWHAEHPDDGADPTEMKKRWSIATRVRVRARNVLRRWAQAQSEPQLVWVDPIAPVKNLQCAMALLGGLYDLRREDGQHPARPPTCPLTAEDLVDLSFRWMIAIVGSGQGDGWFAVVDEGTRAAASRFVDDDFAGMCAALTWQALVPGKNLRHRFIRWQPVVRRAEQHGLLAANPQSAEMLEEITGGAIGVEQIAERLQECRDFIDDDLWCERTAASLDLNRLVLDAPPSGAGSSFGSTVHVDGIGDPLIDPRTVRLIAAVRAYRRKPGVALRAIDKSWRLAVPRDDTATFMDGLHGDMLSSELPIDDDLVAMLSDEAGVLTAWFVHEAVA